MRSLFLFLFTSLMLQACGSSGGGSSISVSASLKQSDYSVAYEPSLLRRAFAWLIGPSTSALTTESTVNRVVAIPHTRGDVNSSTFNDIITASVDSSGAFEIDLSGSYPNWLLLLVNTDAANLEDKVIGYVTIKVQEEDSLVNISTNRATGDVQLGNLSKSGDEAVSSNEAGSETVGFSLSTSQLLALAKADDGYKNLINAYLNYDGTDFFITFPSFVWTGNFSDVLNSNSSPDEISYSGWQIRMETSETETPSFDQVCSSAPGSFKIYPPADITKGVSSPTTYQPKDGGDTPITNDSMESDSTGCYDEDIQLQGAAGDDEFQYNFPTGAGVEDLFQSTVDGFWSLEFAGEQVAAFDFSDSKPVDNSENALVFVPIPRVTSDDSNSITQIAVTWYQFDSDEGGYVEVSVDNIVNELIFSSFVELSTAEGASTSYADSQTAVVSKTGADFSDLSSLQTSEIDELVVGYQMGGVDYRFQWTQ